MRRGSHVTLVFLVIVFLSAGSTGARAESGIVEEIRLPAFDHADVEASYALARPADWDGETALPLILDLHGAIHPAKKGGTLTVERVWKLFVGKVACLVAAPQLRTRGWNRVQGEMTDAAYVSAVLEHVRKNHKVDEKRIYLAGFSSGSDFACNGGLQVKGPFAATLVVCPGPPNVVGIRNGALEKVKKHPFIFATGEEDYVRKSGAFEAFVHLDGLGGKVRYREVPGVGHAFFGVEEYVRLFERLEMLVGRTKAGEPLAASRQALLAGDLLTAQTIAKPMRGPAAKRLRGEIDARAASLAKAAREVDGEKEPGRAYEAWWTVRTQARHLEALVKEAETATAVLEERLGRRDLYRARRAWFEGRPRDGR